MALIHNKKNLPLRQNAVPKVVEELTTFPLVMVSLRLLCGNYSTRGFPCGTLQTPSDVTPCIMTYVSNNMYGYMYRTSLSSSPLKKKNMLKYLAGNSEAIVKNILLIKPIIFYIHCINLSSFHVLVTLARNVLSIHIHSPANKKHFTLFGTQ